MEDHFWKLQAIGNDFVFFMHREGVNYSQLSKVHCARRTGIGADGLLTIDMHGGLVTVRMWNPDGTPDFCGNGLCGAAYLCDHLGLRHQQVLKCNGRAVPFEVAKERPLARVRIGIGEPEFRPEFIPTALPMAVSSQELLVRNRRIHVRPISTGSTHCVVFVDKLPNDHDFVEVSSAIETHPSFPDRTSVLWVVVDGKGLRIRIWERGVGETFGCGTGASAAAATAILASLVESPVAVSSIGGIADVEYQVGQGIWLTVPVSLPFEGRVFHDGYEVARQPMSSTP